MARAAVELSLLSLLAAVLVAACSASPASPAARSAQDEEYLYSVPPGFLIGASVSATQTEGAATQDGKGLDTFEYFLHATYPKERWTDVAADHYNRYREDIRIAKEIGLNSFRMSLSWSRIFPDGDHTKPNQKGIDHYHAVFDYLKELEMEPVVTIFHFVYPQVLHEKTGGWAYPAMMDAFAKFAEFVFAEYASKVKYWITINEPIVYCQLVTRKFQNMTSMPAEVEERCVHNLILSHARASKIYKEKYRSKYHGLMGFGAGPHFYAPASDSAEDKQAAEDANMQYWGFGVTLEPVFHGRYPDQIHTATRPTFTDADKELMKDSVDFLAVNIYDGLIAKHGEIPPYFGFGPSGHGKQNLDTAWVMREMPRWLQQRYGRNVGILISENGVVGGRDDYHTRGAYCSAYLRELLAGMREYGNNILGYMVWSLIDTWEDGFDTPWGLVEVDYKSGSLRRTPKPSARLFQEIKRTGHVPLIEASSAAHLRPTIALAALAVVLLQCWRS